MASLLAAAVVALILTTTARAADPQWRFVGESVGQNPFTVHIDAANVSVNSLTQRVRAWSRFVYTAPNVDRETRRAHDTSFVLNEFDCEQGRMQAVQRSDFLGDEHIDSYGPWALTEGGWVTQRPGSVGGAQVDAACAFLKTPAARSAPTPDPTAPPAPDPAAVEREGDRAKWLRGGDVPKPVGCYEAAGQRRCLTETET